MTRVRGWLPEAVIVCAAVLSAVLVVRMGSEVSPALIWMSPIVAIVAFILFRYGALPFVALAVMLPLVGADLAVSNIGSAELRLSDLCMIPAFLGAVVAVLRGTRVRWGVLLPLTAFAAVTVVSAQRIDTLHVLSALRLCETLLSAVLVAYLCTSWERARFLLRAVAVAGVIAIATAALGGGTFLSDRIGGELGPNTLGLLAALLVAFSLTTEVVSVSALRAGFFTVGLIGLLLAKSVGATVAAAASGVIAHRMVSKGHLAQILVGGVLVAAVALPLVQVFRPETLPWSGEFKTSSAQHRLVVGYAGLQAFADHPLVGTGWQNSDEAITDPQIVASLKSTFAGINPYFLPSLQTTSVHNAYVQVLAELGVFGMIVLVWLGVAVFRAGARDVAAGRALARCVALGLIVVAVWLNDSPLYGGQPETLVLAVLIGVLARTDAEESPPVRESHHPAVP